MSILIDPSGAMSDGAISETKTFILLGDVDGDGFITNDDVNLIFNSIDSQVQSSSGFTTQKASITLTPEQKNRADIDGDGIVSARDAQIIQKYIYERNTKQLPKSANYLVEQISIRNKLRLYEPHNYSRDFNNRIVHGDTLQLINSGASDYDIIGTLLVNENVAPVSIEQQQLADAETLAQKEREASRYAESLTTLKETEPAAFNLLTQYQQAVESSNLPVEIKATPISDTILQIEDKANIQPETNLEILPVKEDDVLPKLLPIEDSYLDVGGGGMVSDSTNIPSGGGSLPGMGIPEITLSDPSVYWKPSEDTFTKTENTGIAGGLNLSKENGNISAFPSNSNNIVLVIIGIIILYFLFS